jgi:aspartyl/asparaginyl-tRNA synthetase
MQKLREFCYKEGLSEVYTQGSLNNLKACEDPNNMGTFGYQGKVWSLPQTGQMELEIYMLHHGADKYPNGLFCQTTSYRNEPNPNPERHDLIFPMFEVELVGDMDQMMAWHTRLLKHLGFPTQADGTYPVISYLEAAKKYGVKELDHEHEERLCKDLNSPVVFLTDFPQYTSPFWNMSRYTDKFDDDGIPLSKKVDILIHGVETIGSAERSTDVNGMRDEFHTISDGAYARTLYQHFTKERIEKELEDFLKFNFFTRSGFGIGVTRLIRGMRMSGLLDE